MAHMTKSRRFLPIRRMAILAFEGVQVLDVAGPLQALTTANEEAGSCRYEAGVYSLSGGPVATASGLPILTKPLRRAGRIDTLIIPGGPGVYEARRSRKLIAAICKIAAASRRQCSVCTGAFLLAETGLLDGRRVVTHWRSCARLAREYPELRIEEDPIYIRDGSLWTSAGVTAGIDMTLALIEEDNGADVALRVARRLVVYLRRPGGQRQFSEPLSLQIEGGESYAALLQSIAERPDLPWQVEDMAVAARQSVRTFFRRFRAATGATPAEAVERIRCEQAKAMLQTTGLPLAAVARRTGFEAEGRMRRAMNRMFGVPPAQLRKTSG